MTSAFITMTAAVVLNLAILALLRSGLRNSPASEATGCESR